MRAYVLLQPCEGQYTQAALPVLIQSTVGRHLDRHYLAGWACQLIQQRFIGHLGWMARAGPERPVIGHGHVCSAGNRARTSYTLHRSLLMLNKVRTAGTTRTSTHAHHAQLLRQAQRTLALWGTNARQPTPLGTVSSRINLRMEQMPLLRRSFCKCAIVQMAQQWHQYAGMCNAHTSASPIVWCSLSVVDASRAAAATDWY